MYKILINGELFVDSRTDELRVVDPVVELEVNTAGTLTLTVPKTHPYYDELEERKSYAEVYLDNDASPLFCGSLVSYVDDFYGSRSATFEGELAYLNDSVQRPAKYTDKTVRQLLEAYIASHNASVESSKQFTVGQVTVDGGSSILRYTNWQNTMTEIAEDLVENFGGYLRVRHQNNVRYLDYLKESPHTSSQVIRLGENLLDFKSNLDTTEICTVLIPLGATISQETQPIEGLEEYLTIKSVNNNKDYLESSTAIAKYGRVEKTMKWDDVTTASALKTKGQAYLTDVQFANVYIEANAIDLHYDNADIERIKLMDTVRVVSEPHGLNRTFMLTKMTINLDAPQNDSFTLGANEIPSLSKTSASVAEKLKKVDELPTSDWITSAIANATALITGNDGGYVVMHKDSNGKPYEILVMDTDNIQTATKVWRWNQSGFGYSSTGYNGTYGTAITMDGAIVADYITTGQLNGALIKANSIGATQIDVDNLTVKKGNFTSSFAVDNSYLKISADSNGATIAGKHFSSGNGYISIAPVNIEGSNSAGLSFGGDHIFIKGNGIETTWIEDAGDCLVISRNAFPIFGNIVFYENTREDSPDTWISPGYIGVSENITVDGNYVYHKGKVSTIEASVDYTITSGAGKTATATVSFGETGKTLVGIDRITTNVKTIVAGGFNNVGSLSAPSINVYLVNQSTNTSGTVTVRGIFI